MPRDDEAILDLHKALQKILTFTQGMSEAEFMSDEKTQSSVVKNAAIKTMLTSADSFESCEPAQVSLVFVGAGFSALIGRGERANTQNFMGL